jgi:hypothetical protein
MENFQDGWPTCDQYADSAALYMESVVDIPNTGAFGVWDFEQAEDLGRLSLESYPSFWDFPHATTNVYWLNPNGDLELLDVYDPWWLAP